MMTDYAGKIIDGFLDQSNPGVLLITGGWGGGKTYAFREALRRRREEFKGASYSYSSLIGVENLDKLKRNIYDNIHETNGNTSHPIVWYTSIAEWVNKKKRSALTTALNAPVVTKHLGDDHAVSLSTGGVKNIIVCIDDVERRPISLSIKDILEYAANLRDHKNCKVVIIYNLKTDSQEATDVLIDMFEKMVDCHVSYDPPPDRAFELAIQSVQHIWLAQKHAIDFLKSICVQLRITNIRVIKRIIDFSLQVSSYVDIKDNDISKRIYEAIAKYCQEKYVKTETYLSKNNSPNCSIGERVLKEKQINKPRKGRCDIFMEKIREFEICLRQYQSPKEFILLPGSNVEKIVSTSIQRGYFTKEEIEETVGNERQLLSKFFKRKAYNDAWELFDNNFDDNEDQFVSLLLNACRENFEHITVIELSKSVDILKKLSREDEARKIIKTYLEQSEDDISRIDLNSIGNDGVDEDIVYEFKKQFDRIVSKNLAYIGAIVSGDFLNFRSRLSLIDNLDDDQFKLLLKSLAGDELRAAIRNCSHLFECDGATTMNNVGFVTKDGVDAKADLQRMHSISKKASKAFFAISQESDINRERMRNYGFEFCDNTTRS